jgi:site-specific recombinase
MTEWAQFRAQLEMCRQATVSVYSHLDEHGISMDLVFRLRQIRARVLRIRSFEPSSLAASSLSMGIMYMTLPMFIW